MSTTRLNISEDPLEGTYTSKPYSSRGQRSGKGRGRRGRGGGGNRQRGRGRGTSLEQRKDPEPKPRGQRGNRSRGRGRGRGGAKKQDNSERGRGQKYPRGGRRGRGKRKAGLSVEDLTRVALLQQQRSQTLHERVAGMRERELRHLVECIMLREPGMVFDVLESGSSLNPGPSPPSPSFNSVDRWCTCGRCREMPSDLERKCCGLHAPECLSIIPEFDLLVTEPMYLRQFIRYRGQVFGIPANANNETMRHAAYTQYILLTHGKLGQGNRRVIPSCCVWQIRTVYPEPNGTYRGFIPSRLA